MRRLFFGRRNRDDRKGGNNDEQRGDGSKTSNPDGIDGAGNEFTAPQQPVLSTAAVPSSNDGNTAPTPVVKQVAFITPVHSPAQPSTPADDIQSLVGTSGLVCFPRHPSSSSNPAQAGQSTIDRANSPKASLHVPSQPTRHVSLDTANRMNNGGLSPDMSKSRQSPLSNTSLPSASNTNVASDPMVRSGTSLSQNTVASTASSAIGGSYLGHSPLYGGPHSASFQPNVTILASYARDQNTDTASNGIRQHLTWSEITNDELVDNLGGRERTRQEVLFEIVCSEERYVQDLLVSFYLILCAFGHQLKWSFLILENASRCTQITLNPSFAVAARVCRSLESTMVARRPRSRRSACRIPVLAPAQRFLAAMSLPHLDQQKI